MREPRAGANYSPEQTLGKKTALVIQAPDAWMTAQPLLAPKESVIKKALVCSLKMPYPLPHLPVKLWINQLDVSARAFMSALILTARIDKNAGNSDHSTFLRVFMMGWQAAAPVHV
ncbi:hypothetical protein ACIOYV_10890 [Pseudomonas sp. NPDC087342]|uniref:hypothetical protein n=1 Tax=Pseudomonas sp. NPDC087342 TaxID=3364437 RepID=UPI003828AEC5